MNDVIFFLVIPISGIVNRDQLLWYIISMHELLAPAGTIEAFYSAIANGADAIYLGLDKYNARAYAANFNLDNLQELTNFAHLRNVKIYVTINTIVYDEEEKDVYQLIDRLAQIHVDGIIVQDLAVLTYIISRYPSIKAVASTQMGIDDVEGTKLVQELGVRRVVYARETPLDTLRKIKEITGIEVETFIHGALCVSYSGNCLMSSMIGERSGNRGRCAGCCRRLYTLVDIEDNNKALTKGYLLSMKDLNTANFIKDMDFVDSFKIEGRMKEPAYVGAVTRLYRQIIDQEQVDKRDFAKVFNRTYTKGFLNKADSGEITNLEKPNNYGYLIGAVEKQINNKIWLSLNEILNKGDQIRIESDNEFEEISVPVLKMFDYAANEIFSAAKNAVIYCQIPVKIGAKVYKTKDSEFIDKTLKNSENKQYKKLPVKMEFLAYIGQTTSLKIRFENFEAFVLGEGKAEISKTTPVTDENITKQLNKLGGTPYTVDELVIKKDDNVFLSLKAINELRRVAIETLNEKRLVREVALGFEQTIHVKSHQLHETILTVEVANDLQYEAAKTLGVKHIYYRNIINRNNASYINMEDEVLVGGLGGVQHYRHTNPVVTDYSLNVVNAKTVAILSSMGVERITLSHEINIDRINNLIKNYIDRFNTAPNLELIVYGRTKVMHSKYCVLKRLNMCGACRKSRFSLKDDFASFPVKFNRDCTMNVYNSKTLNLIDELPNIKGINYFRLSFVDENIEEMTLTIKRFQEKMRDANKKSTFNKASDTHGHFFNNPL